MALTFAVKVLSFEDSLHVPRRTSIRGSGQRGPERSARPKLVLVKQAQRVKLRLEKPRIVVDWDLQKPLDWLVGKAELKLLVCCRENAKARQAPEKYPHVGEPGVDGRGGLDTPLCGECLKLDEYFEGSFAALVDDVEEVWLGVTKYPLCSG